MADLQTKDLRIEEKVSETSSSLSGSLPPTTVTSTNEKDIELQSIPTTSPGRDLGDQVMHGPRFGLFLLGLGLATFLASLDISIIATALPRISSDFNAQSQMAWVATAYLLAYNAFQPLYGRMSDIFGRKQVILFASTIFLIGSLGCGAANSMIMLIIFRAIQGMGGSGLSSVVLIIISDMFEDVTERAKYQSVAWLAFGISSIVGPLLGGAFVEHSTWRWCFYLSLPLGALAVILIALLHKMPYRRTDLKEKLARVDYLGVLLIVLAVVCLLLPLTWGGVTFAWNSGIIIGLFCAFAVLVILLVFAESRATEAIIPPVLFLNREIAIIFVINCLFGLGFMGATFYIPLYFQVVLGASTTSSGLRLMPNVLGIVFSTIVSGVLAQRIPDIRKHIWVGGMIMTLGFGLFTLFDVDSSLGQQIGFVLIMGLGQGLIFQNCMLVCQEAAHPKDIAVATALCGFFNSIGGAIGVAVCAAAFNNGLVRNLAKLPEAMQVLVRELHVVEDMTVVSRLEEEVKVAVVGAYAEAFQFLFTVLVPFVGVGFLLSFFLRKQTKEVQKKEEDE